MVCRHVLFPTWPDPVRFDRCGVRRRRRGGTREEKQTHRIVIGKFERSRVTTTTTASPPSPSPISIITPTGAIVRVALPLKAPASSRWGWAPYHRSAVSSHRYMIYGIQRFIRPSINTGLRINSTLIIEAIPRTVRCGTCVPNGIK